MPQITEVKPGSQQGTWIEIRLSRLIENLRALKTAAGNEPEIMAVIKANAYGHGFTELARALEPHVTYFGLSSLREALELRERGLETPIFLFAPVMPHKLPVALVEGITLSVSGLAEAREISDNSVTLKRQTPVHIKIDTGMGRLGIPFRNALHEIEQIAKLPALRLEGLYTHFPTAERPDGFREKQVRDFELLCRALGKKGIRMPYRHAANSSACLSLKAPVFNLIRPGLMLYGIYPDTCLRGLAPVSAVLSLRTRIILLKRLRPGDSAGYGRDFVADKPATIAVLPIGYSHGYPFTASNRAFVLYQGQRYPLAGRVSMDYTSVNLGDAPARPGDTVTLIGEDGNDAISAEELAGWAGTIPYEVVTRLNASLPRFYL